MWENPWRLGLGKDGESQGKKVQPVHLAPCEPWCFCHMPTYNPALGVVFSFVLTGVAQSHLGTGPLVPRRDAVIA